MLFRSTALQRPSTAAGSSGPGAELAAGQSSPRHMSPAHCRALSWHFHRRRLTLCCLSLRRGFFPLCLSLRSASVLCCLDQSSRRTVAVSPSDKTANHEEEAPIIYDLTPIVVCVRHTTRTSDHLCEYRLFVPYTQARFTMPASIVLYVVCVRQHPSHIGSLTAWITRFPACDAHVFPLFHSDIAGRKRPIVWAPHGGRAHSSRSSTFTASRTRPSVTPLFCTCTVEKRESDQQNAENSR